MVRIVPHRFDKDKGWLYNQVSPEAPWELRAPAGLYLLSKVWRKCPGTIG